jgi:hypothetical protein
VVRGQDRHAGEVGGVCPAQEDHVIGESDAR